MTSSSMLEDMKAMRIIAFSGHTTDWDEWSENSKLWQQTEAIKILSQEPRLHLTVDVSSNPTLRTLRAANTRGYRDLQLLQVV